MLKPLKILAPEDQILFFSDLHYGHNRDFIYTPRGFKDVVEHDNTLVHRWNEVCTDQSTVFHLGDLIFKADCAAFWALLRRLRFGHLYLMLGNHVSGQKQAYVEEVQRHFADLDNLQGGINAEVYPLTTHVDNAPTRQVTFLPEYIEVSATHVGDKMCKAPTTDLVLCHYPIISHHSIGRGSIHLSGHVHGNLPLTHRDTGKGRRLDVGVESVGRPVSLREVKALLAARELDVQDHHGREEAL